MGWKDSTGGAGQLPYVGDVGLIPRYGPLSHGHRE